eukprot:scaffold71449_cov42-Phaeocystis_antarctica.AAC.1
MTYSVAGDEKAWNAGIRTSKRHMRGSLAGRGKQCTARAGGAATNANFGRGHTAADTHSVTHGTHRRSCRHLSEQQQRGRPHGLSSSPAAAPPPLLPPPPLPPPPSPPPPP